MARLTGTAGTITFVARTVMGVTAWSIDYTGSVAETTGMIGGATSGVKTFLPTTSEWSGSCEGHYEDTAAQQPPDPTETIGAPVNIDLRTVALGLSFSGSCICTGCSYSVAVDGTLDYSVTFQGTAALSIA